jgi:hypothetical protein
MGSSGYLITKTSPGPMGVGTTARLVRTDRGRQLHGSMEVTKYEPVHSFTEVSRFGPFSLHARATLAPVAPASTRLELVIDTHARGAIRLLLPLMKGTFGKTMARSLRIIKQHVEATPSPHDVTHLETSGTHLLHAIYGPAAPSRPITTDELSVCLSAGHRD